MKIEVNENVLKQVVASLIMEMISEKNIFCHHLSY